MERESIVERVRRLLALSDSDRNESENEAQAAARIASKLMLEHKIEMAEVKRSDQDDFLIMGHRAGNRNIPRWRKNLLAVLATFNYCEILAIRGAEARHRYGGTVFIVGHRDDAEVVRLIHDHVFRQINTLRERAYSHLKGKNQQVIYTYGGGMGRVFNISRNSDPNKRHWNDQFNLGIVDGIAQALQNQRREAEVDENTRAIVRRADLKTRKFIESQFEGIKQHKDKPREVKDIGAYAAGRIAAESVEVGTGERRKGKYLADGNRHRDDG
jgi:hypothetical protein